MPFFSKIFLPALFAENNINLKLIVKQQSQSAMQIWLHSGTSVSLNEYHQFMALKCTSAIRDLLYVFHNEEAWLESHLGKQLLQESDIIILVRNKLEASLMHDTLFKVMIPSVYLSNKDSVFETIETQ